MTQAAGGLNPDERWKVSHPYDIPGVKRPTMATLKILGEWQKVRP